MNKRYTFAAAAIIVWFGLVCIGLTGCGDGSGSGGDDAVKLTRDDKGVWFITGGEDASYYDIFEAQGYAEATDRLWQAETYRRSARGRLAEVFGISQLSTDVYMRTTGYSEEELEAAFASLDTEYQDAINGYVAGFNRRISEIRNDPSLLPFEFAALGNQLGIDFVPEDWTATDVLAWTALMLRNFDPEGIESHGQLDNAQLLNELMAKYPADFMTMFGDLRWTNDPDALTYIPDDAAQAMLATAGDAAAQGPSSVTGMAEAIRQISGMRDTVEENLKKVNANVKMGSYAWVVSGSKTESGNPILYSGPQMGFSVPSIVLEGSIDAADLKISGMSVVGIPGIIIGRTPHHAWSMQVGHAHTVDFYLESSDQVTLHRLETIKVAGSDDVILPVYRSSHGPIVNPIPYDPATYVPSAENPIVAWKYSHWGFEHQATEALLALARAQSMDEFGAGINKVPVSQHFCYADKDGNIAYWMSGRDPVRPAGDWRFPQGFLPGSTPLEWDTNVLKPRSTDRNTGQGYYGGWNNKSSSSYENSYNTPVYYFGPFHRAHVIDEYLRNADNLTFEDLRDLAPNIAATDSIRLGGNPYAFVETVFEGAVADNPTESRTEAVALLDGFDGHFVDGDLEDWIGATVRSDAWVLTDKWIREVIRLTFADELETATMTYEDQDLTVLFNTILHALNGDASGVVTQYDWFRNLEDAAAPQTAQTVILTALDNVLATLGPRPWNVPRSIAGEREIVYRHDLIGEVHETPFGSRSTYAHCVEMGLDGPVRIESMFPLGQSGQITMNTDGTPKFDPNFFSMTSEFDSFSPRNFPLFE